MPIDESMTTLPDVVFVALFAGVGPLMGYFLYQPAYRRLLQVDPAWARWWLWATNIGELWTLVAFGAALWSAGGRSWSSFGLMLPDGWRLWAAIGLCLLLAAYYGSAFATLTRSAAAMASVRVQLEPIRSMMPQTWSELCWFGGVSLTAGFCEEFLYRGYFIWVFAPWLGWWGAAALSLVIFAVSHLYQGWNGVVRTGIVGGIYTLVVATLDSLWPAIAIHALVDLAGGVMAWMALRAATPHSDQAEAPASAEPSAAPEGQSSPS